LGEHKGETAVSAIEVDKRMERMKLERLCGHSIISRLDHHVGVERRGFKKVCAKPQVVKIREGG
jgi:hypothetical protein